MGFNSGFKGLICTYELKFMWRLSTLIFPSLIARRQSIAASVQKLPNSVVKSSQVSTARHSVDVSGETIRLSTSLMLAVSFLRVTYIKD